jgi:hypothetical protein
VSTFILSPPLPKRPQGWTGRKNDSSITCAVSFSLRLLPLPPRPLPPLSTEPGSGKVTRGIEKNTKLGRIRHMLTVIAALCRSMGAAASVVTSMGALEAELEATAAATDGWVKAAAAKAIIARHASPEMADKVRHAEGVMLDTLISKGSRSFVPDFLQLPGETPHPRPAPVLPGSNPFHPLMLE